MKSVNDAIRFLVELAALAAVAYWGFREHSSWALKLVFGLGGVVAITAVWGAWMAPRSERRAPELARALIEILIFGSAAAAPRTVRGDCAAVGSPLPPAQAGDGQ